MEPSVSCVPEFCGKRLIPALIDDIARIDPDRPFVSIPMTLDPRDGFKDVSYRSFADAVDRCAWWLEKQLGTSSTFETITYLSHGRDFAYFILTLAAIKTGYKALYTSPRNSIEAHLSLIDRSGCRIFLVQQEPPPIVYEILRSRKMRTVPVPPLDAFLAYSDDHDDSHVSNYVQHYPFNKTFEEARHEPFAIFQTSGSTGVPKPIVMSHGTFASLDAHQLIPGLGGKVTSSFFITGSRWFNGFPHYHTGCYLYLFGYGVFNNIATVLAPARPLTANIVNLLQVHGKCTGLVTPPSLLDDLARDSSFLSDLGRLKYVAYSGGPLSRSAGDKIASVTKLFNWFGSTEAAMYPTVIHDEGWEYVEFSPFLGFELRLIEDNLYELVFVRNDTCDLFQGVFCTYPELSEYPTKELYTPHPSVPGLWRNQGRLDDIIAFSNAEKFNPVDTETAVCSHPAVKRALVAGQGRFQASLLIEPVTHPSSKEAEVSLLAEIWPTIEKANRSCVAQGRIEKDLVMLTTPNKTMLTTCKGTLRKRATANDYEKELDDLYAAVQAGTGTARRLENTSSPSDDGETLRTFLRLIFSERAGKNDMEDDEDLWALGLDSLHVIALNKDIQAYMKRHQRCGRLPSADVTKEMLYSSRSIAKLEAKLTEVQMNGAEPVDSVK